MGKSKTFWTILILNLFISNLGFSQKTIDGTYLFKKNDKYFLDNQLYSGEVVYFRLGQVSHKYTMLDGIPIGIYTTYHTDNDFIRERFRDTLAIRKFRTDSVLESVKINNLINDSLAIYKQIEEFKTQIGGEKKLNKLKDRYANNKLNKKNQELWNNFSSLSSKMENKRNEIKLSYQKYYEIGSKIKTEQEKQLFIPIVKEEYEQTNFVKTGTYKEYSASGNLLSFGRFQDNFQVGEWIYNYGNGKLKGKGFFNSGRGGESDSKGIPKNGREGKWLVYHENGNLYYESEFKNGKLNGLSKIYFENGQEKEEAFYKDDIAEGLGKMFYENGKLLKEYTIVGNEYSDICIEYYSNGNRKIESNYLNGKLHGVFKTYFENGNIKEQRNYVNHKLEGPVVFYNENGIKTAEYFLTDDLKNGKYKKYYENGKTKEEGNYINDKIEGLVLKYDELGKIKTKVKYNNGIPENNEYSKNVVNASLSNSVDNNLQGKKIANKELKEKNCNHCICIRVFSPTKAFKDKAKALFFSHLCEDKCESCNRTGGLSATQWVEHYKKVYPEAQSVSTVGSSNSESLKNCGCNPR
jgi:antitoxin component YwqK of YwqJK toxin-antitoxin module